jgi:hypothetical protein
MKLTGWKKRQTTKEKGKIAQLVPLASDTLAIGGHC